MRVHWYDLQTLAGRRLRLFLESQPFSSGRRSWDNVQGMEEGEAPTVEDSRDVIGPIWCKPGAKQGKDGEGEREGGK